LNAHNLVISWNPGVESRHRTSVAATGSGAVGVAPDSLGRAASVITTVRSPVDFRVMHTDEEAMIAKPVCRILNRPAGREHTHDQQDENAPESPD
jgi:hypothetical protein